jgi:tRNA (uracil-5-)-methyltransferase
MQKEQMEQDRRKRRKQARKPETTPMTCSSNDVLAFEVDALLRKPRPELSEEDRQAAEAFEASSKEFDELTLDIEVLSATGEGLARHPTLDHVYVVPFSLAGERVKANAPLQKSYDRHNNADLVEVLVPSALREGVVPKCKYFGTCSGCQLQMISYTDQLKHKKTIVEQAYRDFSGLETSQYPIIQDTGSSPLQYHYRTKLTPHFDGPRRGTSFDGVVPPIGFTKKGFRKVMDIESCPIGTPIVEEGLRLQRAKVAANINKYKRGATILLRETTERSFQSTESDGEHAESIAKSPLKTQSLETLPPPIDSSPPIKSTTTGPIITYKHPLNAATIIDTKTYTTADTGPAYEQIGSYTFSTRAGSFFQNNNSILPSFLSHVRSLLASSVSPSPTNPKPLKYLLDAYCGSGLFALTLSPLFTSVLGIELDTHGITSARMNAKNNGVTNAGFVEADAAALFADVPFPADQTALVIDPPRKGCSVEFLRQLLRFGPAKIVYVSCNVNSQARDVGCLVKGLVGDDFWRVPEDGEGVTRGRWRYEIESLQGWDFFPQTAHVEGLCVLKRVENEEQKV